VTTSSAERVAQLLLAFEPDGPGGEIERSVSELARIVGRERTQVSRMLRSLSTTKVVEQDPETRRYRLGWRMRALASEAGDRVLCRAARPMLQALVARTGEATLLSVLEGNRSLTVMREEPHNSLRGGGWVGRRSPLNCTASGRVLLFDYDDEVIDALTEEDLQQHPGAHGQAPADLSELITRVRAEHRRGYSRASEEIEVGLTSIGVPVRDIHRRVIAAVNVSGPTQRLEGRVDEVARLLMAASASITRALTKGR